MTYPASTRLRRTFRFFARAIPCALPVVLAAHATAQGKPDIRWMKGLGAGEGQITLLSYSDDGQRLIRVLIQTIQITRASDGMVLKTIPIRNAIFGCGISTDGTRAAVCINRPKQGGGSENVIQLLDLGTGGVVWETAGVTDATRLRFVAGNSVIAAWNPNTSNRHFLRVSDGQPAYAIPPLIAATPQFSPNGNEMAVNDGQTFNNRIHFYDLANGGIESRSWTTNGWGVLPYSQDGQRILDRSSYFADSSFRVRATSDGAILSTLPSRAFQPGGGYFYDAIWPDNSSFLVPGTNDPTGAAANFFGFIDRFDLTTGDRTQLFPLDVRTSSIAPMLSPDKSTLALGIGGPGGWGWVNYLRFYDPITGVEKGREEGHGSTVSHAAYHPNGRIIATAGWDNTIRMWDRLTGSLLRIVETDYPVVKAQFSHDGKYLVGTFVNGGAAPRIWNTADYSASPVMLGGGVDAAISFDNQYAVTAGSNGYAIRQASNGALLHSNNFPSVAAAACSPTKNIAATAGGYVGFNYQVNLIELPTGNVLWWGSVGFYPTAAEFTDDGTKLILAGRGGVAAIKVAGASSVVLWSKTFPDSTNYRLGVEPCGKYVITGFDSTVTHEVGKVVILRMSDGQIVKTYDDETGFRQWYAVYGAGWSPDGESIAYTRWDGQVVEARNPFYELPHLLSVTASPAVIAGGAKATGTVNLDCPAPVVLNGQYVAGAVVSLTSSNPALVQVPSTVTVPGPDKKVIFSITTSGVNVPTQVTIKATYNGGSKSKILTLNPPDLSKIAVTPTSVNGGLGATGTVTLTGAPAPGTGGFTVALSSGSSAASVPSSVTVPEGALTATFAVSTVPVAANTIAALTASANGIAKSVNLTVKAPVMASVKLSPATVRGGTGSLGTVTLTSVAPVGGMSVTLGSSNAAAAQVPASVVVPAGSKSATFPVTTSAVGANTAVTITATLGVSKTATLTVTP